MHSIRVGFYKVQKINSILLSHFLRLLLLSPLLLFVLSLELDFDESSIYWEAGFGPYIFFNLVLIYLFMAALDAVSLRISFIRNNPKLLGIIYTYSAIIIIFVSTSLLSFTSFSKWKAGVGDALDLIHELKADNIKEISAELQTSLSIAEKSGNKRVILFVKDLQEKIRKVEFKKGPEGPSNDSKLNSD